MSLETKKLDGYRRLIALIHTAADEQDAKGMVDGDKILRIIKRYIVDIEDDSNG